MCFVTSDAIDTVNQNNRVAVKDHDVIESLERLGFGHYISVLEAQMRIKRISNWLEFSDLDYRFYKLAR